MTLFHQSIEDCLAEDLRHAAFSDEKAYIAALQRLLQTLDGHNAGARADVAAILGVDDLKPKIGPQ